ncbi:hypothetical protein LINGRAHAP2_LOCUS28458, partial [Linum grandiflorum]
RYNPKPAGKGRRRQRETEHVRERERGELAPWEMAIDDDDEGFGDFIFAPPPPLNLNTFIRPESSAIASSMAPNFVQDDDWGDFINSSGAGGFSHPPSSLSIPSDLFATPVAVGKQDGVTKKKPVEKRPSGAFPLSLFGEMEEEEEAAGEESGAGLKNSDPVKKNAAVNVDVNDLIADLYKPNGDSKPNGSAREGRNGVASDPMSWGHTSGFGNGLIANGTNEVKSESRDFDPLNLISNGLNSNGDMSGSVLQGSNLNSGSNVASGNEGFDDEEDDDGWEFKAADSNVEEIAKQPEQMMNQNGMTFNQIELNSSWNGANLDFSGWSTSANGVDQRSNSMNDGSVGEREDLAASDTWGFAVAGSNGAPVEEIKIDKTTEDVSKENFDGSNLSRDVVQHPDSNGLTSSLSALNSNVVQADPVFLDENDEFSDAWAFKDAESDLQDTQVKMENDLKIQFSAADSSVNISNLGGAGLNSDLFAADWDTREASSDVTQTNHNLSAETEDPDGGDEWEFKISESESGPIDSSSKANNLTHSRSTGALPLSLFGDEEKDANDLALHEVSLVRISAPKTRKENRGLSSSLSINDLISSLYNEVEQPSPVSHLHNQGENLWGPSETVLASTSSNGIEVLDDDSWEFKDASSSIPVEEKTSVAELPDWIELFSKLKDELCLIAYQHLDNIKVRRLANELVKLLLLLARIPISVSWIGKYRTCMTNSADTVILQKKIIQKITCHVTHDSVSCLKCCSNQSFKPSSRNINYWKSCRWFRTTRIRQSNF